MARKASYFISNSQLAWSKGSWHGLASIGVMNGSEGIADHDTGWNEPGGMRGNPMKQATYLHYKKVSSALSDDVRLTTMRATSLRSPSVSGCLTVAQCECHVDGISSQFSFIGLLVASFAFQQMINFNAGERKLGRYSDSWFMHISGSDDRTTHLEVSMWRYMIVVVFSLVCRFVTPLPAHADSIGFSGEGGTISYAGGASPLVGSLNLGSPLNVNGGISGDYFLSGGKVDFSTGPLAHFASFGPSSGEGIAYFSPGGQVTITGSAVAFAAPHEVVLPLGTILFSGNFTGTPGDVSVGLPGSNPTLQVASLDPRDALDARIKGTLNPSLASLLGLPTDVLYTGGLSTPASLVSFGPFTSGAAFTFVGFSATSIPAAPIPEPATILLLVSGLAVIGLWKREQ
jgi:hypothetical protein